LLFTITLIPFTSGLLGLYAENPLAVDIFAGNILVGSLASLATARFIKNADSATYLWILIAFLPDIVIRATRRRPGPPPAASGPVLG